MRIKPFIKERISILILTLSRLIQLPMALLLKQCVYVVAITGSIFVYAQWSRAADVYVDVCATGPEPPYHTLTSAVAAAAPNDSIFMKGGVYPETITISKALTITAYDGSAIVGIGNYDVGSTEVCVPVTVVDGGYVLLPQGTCAPLLNAKVYYPALSSGGSLACGVHPAVVYAHGLRGAQDLCSWSEPLAGEIYEDYLQAEGILTRLAESGIIAISVDVSSGALFNVKGSIIINTIAYLRDENQRPGSWLEDAVDLSRVGLSGHSTGGAAAIFAASNVYNPPFDQLNLSASGVQIQGLGLIAPACPVNTINPSSCFEEPGADPSDVPTLAVHGTREPSNQVGDNPILLYNESINSKHLIVVTGANHFGYTDGICLLPPDDCSSTVGGVTDQEAQSRQQLTAGNYLHAFYLHYLNLPGKAGAIDYLTQQTGDTCAYPGTPPLCDNSVSVACGQPTRSFADLDSLNVEVNVCSCTP